MSAGRDGLVAVNAAGADNADGGLHLLHGAGLHRRCMGAQQHIGRIAGNEECVLHIAGRVVSSKVQRREHMPVILHLRAIGNSEAHTGEDVKHFGLDQAEGVTGSDGKRGGRAGQVKRGLFVLFGFGLDLLAQSRDFVGSQVFEFVDKLAYFALLLGRDSAEIVEKQGYFSLLAQILHAQGLNLLLCGSGESGDARLQFVNFINHSPKCRKILQFHGRAASAVMKRENSPPRNRVQS